MLTGGVRLVAQCRHLVAYVRFVTSACIVFSIRVVADVYIINAQPEDTTMPIVIRKAALLIDEIESLTVGVIVHAHRIAYHTSVAVLLREVASPTTLDLLNL